MTILEKRRPGTALLYGISDRQAFPRLEPLHYEELLFQTAADILQWREKDLNPADNRKFIRRGVELSRQTGKLFLVNTHVELALEEGAQGAHLTAAQDLAHALELKRQFKADHFTLGKSVHSVREAETAEKQGADYVLLGPVFEPLSKASGIEPLGLSALREAAHALYIPVFALGGMDESLFPEIRKTNAVGVAGMTWLRREVEKLLPPQQ